MLKAYTAIIEKDNETGILVGYIPGINGAHSQGDTVDEVCNNLQEVLELLIEDGEVIESSTFITTQQINIAA